MSRSGEIVLEFGGEERTFRLALKQLEKVQEKCDAGPSELLARMAPLFVARQAGLSFDQILANGLLGTWRVHDIREPILQGLLGANVAGPDALSLVKEWVEDRPLIESVATAYQIVLAAIVGAGDEAAMGESQAAAAASASFPEGNTDMAKTASTQSAGRSAGPRSRSAT